MSKKSGNYSIEEITLGMTKIITLKTSILNEKAKCLMECITKVIVQKE